ncbi:MAG: hypothetical protein HYX78_00835 [Armatimonadetes bacterium]|nr:hypothetical protein [Armatimonadota bacterium]
MNRGERFPAMASRSQTDTWSLLMLVDKLWMVFLLCLLRHSLWATRPAEPVPRCCNYHCAAGNRSIRDLQDYR